MVQKNPDTDEYENKTLEEMDPLIKQAQRELTKFTKKFNNLAKKYMPRPS